MFLLTYYVMAFIGGLVPTTLSEAYPIELRLQAASVYVSGILTFLLSSVLTAKVLRFNQGTEVAAFRNRVQESTAIPGSSKVLRLFLVILLVSHVISYVFYFKGNIPIIQAIQTAFGGSSSRDLLRSVRFDLVYQPGASVFEQFRYVLGPFTNLALLLLGHKWGQRKYVWAGLACLPLTVLLLLGTGQRHPLVSFVVLAFITIHYVSPALLRRVALPGGLAVLVALAGQTFMLGRFAGSGDMVTDLWTSFELVLDRFVRPTAEVAYFTYWEFAGELPRMGATWLNDLSGLVPFIPPAQLPFSKELFGILFGKDGTAAPPGMVEAFVNLGILGPAILGVVLGCLLTVLFVRGVRMAQNSKAPALDAAFLAFFTYLFARIGQGGLMQPFYFGLIPMPILWWYVRKYVGAQSVSE
jgi:oligosaccharide repeat unit polymerase